MSEGRLISENAVVLSGRSVSSAKRMTSRTNTTDAFSVSTGSGSAGGGGGVSEGGVVFRESP